MFTLGVNQDNNRGEIFESVNALPVEVIAHRLAMIPIPTCPEDSIVAPDDCPNCKDMAEEDRGCPLCQVLYTLNVQGPSADSDEPYRVVRAGDLTNVSDPTFDISDEMQSILITYLAQGQFLEFIAFATLGRGRTSQVVCCICSHLPTTLRKQNSRSQRRPRPLTLTSRPTAEPLMRNFSPTRSVTISQPFSTLRRLPPSRSRYWTRRRLR